MRISSLLSAAAVVVLSVAFVCVPSQARVVYTPVNQSITGAGDLLIDLNADGINDFDIHQPSAPCYPSSWVYPNKGDGVIFVQHSDPWATALAQGYLIGPGSNYAGAEALLAQFTLSGCPFPHGGGYWLNAGPHYLGLQFTKFGKVRFGWAELSVSTSGFNRQTIRTTLMGFAYQTIVGKSILAGQT